VAAKDVLVAALFPAGLVFAAALELDAAHLAREPHKRGGVPGTLAARRAEGATVAAWGALAAVWAPDPLARLVKARDTCVV